MRKTSGQATIEWVGLVALVCVLLALGPTLAHASFVGNHITRAYARALCLVRGGDCARDTEPCVTASDQSDASAGADFGFVHVGNKKTYLVAGRSDGSYAIMDAGELSGGLTAGIGVDFDLAGLAIDASADASATAAREGARTWIVPTAAAAVQLLARLRNRDAMPPPTLRHVNWNLKTGYEATASVEDEQVMHGERSFDDRRDSVVDSRTGHRTITTGYEESWGASVLGLSTSGEKGSERYALEVDREGHPIDLQIVAFGGYRGSQDLPSAVSPIAGMLDARGSGDRRYEVTAHLDLTEPENLAAARPLVMRLLRPVNVGWSPGVPQALRRLVDERGTVEARVIDQTTTSDDYGGHIAFGGKVGVDVHSATASVRLLAAASRGLDGNWITRDDCVAPA